MDTFRAIRRVLWITMGLNLIATAAKLIVGYWTDASFDLEEAGVQLGRGERFFFQSMTA